MFRRTSPGGRIMPLLNPSAVDGIKIFSGRKLLLMFLAGEPVPIRRAIFYEHV
jgi:hypothetical protein